MAEKSVPRALALPAVGTLLTGYIRFISAQDLQDCRQRLGLLGDHYKHGQPWPSQTVPADASEEQKGEFMRAYRQYMNLVEWTGIAQCIFWTSAIMTREAYGVKSKAFKWVAYASVFWPVARLGYGKAYQRDARLRAPFFFASTMAVLTSLIAGSAAALNILREEYLV